MKKRFNVTGRCIEKWHYMADASKKLEQTLEMVEMREYFIINRPRQYGKTTILNNLEDVLRARGDYFVFSTSFEGISQSNFDNDASLAAGFVRILASSVRYFAPDVTAFMFEDAAKIHSFEGLSDYITALTLRMNKKVVVLIDEVDQSANNEHKYIIELKRWYGEVYHEKGTKQLCDYLDIQGEKTGFLVIFEHNKAKSGRKEWIERNGKRIFAVWV